MDKQLFESFYSQNFKKLVNQIKRNHINKVDAEDLAQDIMLKVFEQHNDYVENEIYFWQFVKGEVSNFKAQAKRESKNQEKLIKFLKNSSKITIDDLEYLLTQLEPNEQEFIRGFLKEGKITKAIKGMSWNNIQRVLNKCKKILKGR